jgi:hypothetical protein
MKDTETIYTDIPLPEKSPGLKGRSRWEKFKTIEVGQCVFVDTRSEANSLKVYLLRHDMKLATRKVDGQFGVWRVADE